MNKYFVCLANSKKYTQRCVAGIELIVNDRSCKIVETNNAPVWIRPISATGHGEVDSSLVDHIRILDIVEINATRPHPQGYQTENILFDNKKLNVIGSIEPTTDFIDQLVPSDEELLFGNRGKAVASDDIIYVSYSLVFIKALNVSIYQTKNARGDIQVRAEFQYATTIYNLPITDIEFIENHLKDPTYLESYQHIYFTISLGVEHNGWHSKLIAGIVYF